MSLERLQKLLVPTFDLPEEGQSFSGKLDAGFVAVDSDDMCRVSEPLHYDLFAQLAQNELIVRGTLSLNVGLSCSRCLSFFSTIIRNSSFLRVYALADEQVEVDLTSVLRETIWLRIPQQPLCKTDCKGLCPCCGTNLNERTCDCQDLSPDGRWQTLDKLGL